MRLPARQKRKPPRVYVIGECDRAAELSSERIPAQSARSRAARLARNRIGMCATLFVVAFGLLALRLYAVSSGGVATTPTMAGLESETAPRGEITDRHGSVIAMNLPMTALEVAGREVWNARETAEALQKVFPDLDVEDVAAQLAEGRYREIAADLTPQQRQAVFDLGLPGVRFAPRVKRFYPHGALAAHIVGHTEPGRGGVMGLEKTLDLRPGAPLAASIDLRAQQAVEEALDSYVATFEAEAGWAAVMDVATGEIVALANAPDFDPNAPGAAPADSRRNRAAYDNYELGSAFKIFTAAAALEEGVATTAKLYDARKPIRVADRSFGDFHGENRVLSFSEVVQFSSNIGAVTMAMDLGTERQKEYLSALGLTKALALDVPEMRAPGLPAQWGPVETATISFGHGISVTPLHLLAAFAAVVDGGIYRTPTFVKAERAAAGARVFSEETSLEMRRVLRRVISSGTASKAEAPGYFPIGKTATAEKLSSTGRYLKNERISTFVGAFPGHAPRYAVLVTLDNPKPVAGTFGYATAGWNAAPLFADITTRLAPVLGVMPVDDAFAEMALFGNEAPGLGRRAALDGKVDAR